MRNWNACLIPLHRRLAAVSLLRASTSMITGQWTVIQQQTRCGGCRCVFIDWLLRCHEGRSLPADPFRAKCTDLVWLTLRVYCLSLFVCVCVFCVFMFYGLKPEINAFIHSFIILYLSISMLLKCGVNFQRRSVIILFIHGNYWINKNASCRKRIARPLVQSIWHHAVVGAIVYR